MNYKDIIEQNNGVILFNQLKQLGLTRSDLNQMVKLGLLEKIMHGVYINPNASIDPFWLLGNQYKNGIFSHNTALYFYHMTDRTPLKIDLTFPSNNRINNEKLHVHYIKKELYKLGLTQLTLDNGIKIAIYNKERTICDIIRDRHQIDPQIFNTAINEYIKQKDKNLFLLYQYAKAFKIDKILIQYMEVLQI